VYIIVKIGHARDIKRFNISTPKSLIATRLFIFLSNVVGFSLNIILECFFF